MILGLVGFVGGVAVTRFMSRDSDEHDAVEVDHPEPRQQPEGWEQS
jgi:multicomponent Na+:H+ antiporter subunit F